MTIFNRLLVLLLLMGLSLPAFSTARQGTWRWRNDNGGETTATWMADQDTPITLTHKNNIRLRIELANIDHNFDLNSETINLQYTNDGGTSWHVITTDESTSHFVFSTSSHFNNQDQSTNQLLSAFGSYGEVQGYLFDTNDPNNKHRNLPANTTTELEFCIKATDEALDEVTYEFQLLRNSASVTKETTAASLFTDFSDLNEPVKAPLSRWGLALAALLILLGSLIFKRSVF
ncbi:MAG: hypothetical protein ACLFS0_02490 [Bacteroidales bacterium]